MLKIGLTGGIGSGKSTVAKYFAELKVPLLDADKIAHDLFLPESISYKKVLDHFGTEILTPKKTINRRKIKEIVFSDDQERIWLEKLMHPLIRTTMEKRISETKAPYVIMVIPLLFETEYPIKVDRILVVDCPTATQIKRAKERDNSSTSEIQAIIQKQTPHQNRLEQADDIIPNNGSLTDLKQEVKKLHDYYLSIS